MVDNEQLFLGFDKEQLTKLFYFMSIMIVDRYVCEILFKALVVYFIIVTLALN